MAADAARFAGLAGFAVVPADWGVQASATLLARAGELPSGLALGGPQSDADQPVRAVAGIGGSSHSLQPRSVSRLVSLCRHGQSRKRRVDARPRGAGRAPSGAAAAGAARRGARQPARHLGQHAAQLGTGRRGCAMSTSRADAEVVIDAGIDEIWNAITSSEQAYRWWGLSDGDLDQVAREVTVQTGSSSFYRLWIDRIAAPRLLEFTSSYLGVTPTTTVRWELEPDAGSRRAGAGGRAVAGRAARGGAAGRRAVAAAVDDAAPRAGGHPAARPAAGHPALGTSCPARAGDRCTRRT